MKFKSIETEEFCIFSDESHYNTGRFHAISALSLPYNMSKELHDELKNTLKDLYKKEFKWNKFNGDSNYTKYANSLMDWFYTYQNAIRLDTIIWDTNDTRHDVLNRDDNKNFSIMYYRLLDHIIGIYTQNTTFHLFPDNKDGFNWKRLESFLTQKNDFIVGTNLFEDDMDYYYIRNSVHDIKPTDSKDCIFIQLTDLFAGLAVYSYTEYNNFLIWERQNNPQMTLFPNPIYDFSKAQKARFYFLNNFICKFDIDINKNCGLSTPAWNKRKCINFWLYKPQRIEDKAPIKSYVKN